MKTIKILLAEPSDVIAAGFQELLGADSPFVICGCCSSAEGLKEAVVRYRPALLLINPSLLGDSAVTELSSLTDVNPHIVFVALVYQYFSASMLRPYAAVVDICDSKMQIENKLKQVLKNQDPSETGEGYELTQREKDVLVLVAKGLMNKEIADKLNLSVHTVITHRKNITHKTDIKSVAGLTVYALLNNLIDKDEVL
ncbi:MAG: response regulator transcription factor [Bacteroidales bacterium]|nr:response regulator transcription factor [Bacteroidales bacterium]